jgi:tetratricopeptide (TPR) repeat protein
MSLSRYLCALSASVIAAFVAVIAWSKPFPADKPEIWTEVQTPHFIVASDDGENTARRIADQFEQIRFLYSKTLNRGLRLDPGIPILIFAVKNEKALSQLIPEYWAQKGHTHPAGLFVPGQEKNYIALRTDVESEFPYLAIYHEYVHLIVNLNYQHFPIWLNEGFADFLGSATLTAKGGKLGQPSSWDLDLLQQSKLLPLETLFKVDYQSPYYNEANKTTIFYAESWALVHYLMLDPEKQNNQALGKYISFVESGADPVEAATRAFGDLGQLQKALQSYINRTSYMEYSVALPAKADAKDYSVRAISAAEAQARLGDFDLYRGQLDAAHKKLEEAIRLDPDLAAAQESMGLLLFRQDERYGAEKYFARAVALDSKSALAYFYHAMLLTSQGSDAEQIAEARTALEKAVALNPGLGSAWSNLALLYANAGTLDNALSAAKRAVDTMPGEPHFQYNLAVVLARMERYDEARTVARKLQTSGNSDIVSVAGKFLTQLDQAQQYAAYKKMNESNSAAATTIKPETTSSAESIAPVLRRKTQNTANPAPAEDAAGPTAATDAPSAPAAPRAYSMVGTITDVNCTAAPQIRMTLKAQSIVMHLHSGDFSQVAVKSASANSAAKNFACASLRGRNARVSYQLASEKDWDGELVSIEFRDTP